MKGIWCNGCGEDSSSLNEDMHCPSCAKIYDRSIVDWGGGGRVHNWKNYASQSLRDVWSTLSKEQRNAIVESLENVASNEEWE